MPYNSRLRRVGALAVEVWRLAGSGGRENGRARERQGRQGGQRHAAPPPGTSSETSKAKPATI
eukprot:1088885-Prymnesium_polylepis.1